MFTILPANGANDPYDGQRGMMSGFLLTAVIISQFVVPTATAQPYGTSWDFPAMALVQFSSIPSDCDLDGSWVVMQRNWVDKPVRPLSHYRNNGKQCRGNVFERYYFGPFTYSNGYFNEFGLTAEAVETGSVPNTCTGVLSLDVGWLDSHTSADESITYNQGRLLCNDDNMIAFVGHNTAADTSDYVLWWAARSGDDSTNQKTMFLDYSTHFAPVVGGPYCDLNFKQLMTKVMQDAASTDWNNATCEGGLIVPQPEMCIGGQVNLCSTNYGGGCFDIRQDDTCTERMQACQSETTCGLLDGCTCVRTETPGVSWHDAIITCDGNAASSVSCSEFSSQGDCLSQNGCLWCTEDNLENGCTNPATNPPPIVPTGGGADGGSTNPAIPPTSPGGTPPTTAGANGATSATQATSGIRGNEDADNTSPAATRWNKSFVKFKVILTTMTSALVLLVC